MRRGPFWNFLSAIHDMTIPGELYVLFIQGYIHGKAKTQHVDFLRVLIEQCKCKCAVI
jgi:hypothetical protein